MTEHDPFRGVPRNRPEAAEVEPPAEAPADDVPEKAADVVAWVGSDPERARRALAAEAERPEADQRKSVLALASLTS